MNQFECYNLIASFYLKTHLLDLLEDLRMKVLRLA